MLREVAAAGNYAGGSADRSAAGGLPETQIGVGGGEEPPVGIADHAVAFGHGHLTVSRGLDRKNDRTAAQSGATSMAWPVWALFVTASVNSM